MSKVEMQCIGCGKHILVNIAKRGHPICAACRRKGVKMPLVLCERCGIPITKKLRSIRSRLCVVCYAADIKVEMEAARNGEVEVRPSAPVTVYLNDDTEPSDITTFGGFVWRHANVTPVG